MSRYIDAEKIEIPMMEMKTDETWMKIAIKSVPTADVRENVRGKWIDKSKGVLIVKQCSVCDWQVDYKFPFCPYCGANMRGEKDG